MSYIEKMTIQGIRSFGTSDHDKGMIMFFAPLTLILGPNGTGKTTIIECLKYMTTGEMPPCGKLGAAFIHDPKIAGDSEVKAQIRLLFNDVHGQKCVAVRSLIATQKKNKVELKTLDSTMMRQLSNGEKRSVSSKCTEMDREMVALLGVSKAVLENVIFCHQEESSWPLSEGRMLKQKFDDIFASTRYVKALDSIRKCRQEQMQRVREYQAEIKYLKQSKDKAAQIAADLSDRENYHLAAMVIVQKVDEKLQPVTAKLDQIMTRETEIFEVRTRIEKKKGERSQMEKAQCDLRLNIKQEFSGTTDELQRELQTFENKVMQMEQTLVKNQDKLIAVEKEAAKLHDERSKLLNGKGRLEEEAERHKRIVKNRDEQVQKLSDQYNLSGFTDVRITDNLTRLLISNLEHRARDILDNAKSQRIESEKRETEFQSEIDKLRRDKTKLETEHAMNLDKRQKNHEQIKSISNELCRVDASANRLQDIERDIRNTELEVEEAESSVDCEELKIEIRGLFKEKTSMDMKLKELETELTRLTQENSVRVQLDVYCKDRTSKEDQIKRLKVKNEDTLQHILGAVPTENFAKTLEKYLRDHSRQLRTNADLLQTMQKRVVELETRRKMQQETLTKKQEDLRNYETEIVNVTKGMDFETSLESVQNNLQKKQDNKGHLMAVDLLFKKYIDKLRAHDPACPLCHRPFDESSEIEELISEMETKLSMVPEKLDRVTVLIGEAKEDYEKLLQLKPLYSTVKELKSNDNPTLESNIQSLNNEIVKLRAEVSEKEELVELDKNDESMAKSMLADLTQIDRLQSELQDLVRKIETQSAKLAPGGAARSLQEVQNLRSELQLELELVNQKLERKRQKLTEYTEKLQQLKCSLNELKSEKLQIETDLQRRTRLEENKDELTAANESLSKEIRETEEEIHPIQDKIDKFFGEKDSVSRSKEADFEKAKEKCSAIRDHVQHVERFQGEINRYVDDGRAEKLSACIKRLTELDSNKVRLDEQRVHLVDLVNQTQQDFAEQKIYQRELVDNLQVRQQQTEIDKVSSNILQEEEYLGGLDVENLTRERKRLDSEHQKLINERDTARLRQKSLEGEIMAFRNDLKSDMYKDADVKYRDQMIQLRTTELAINDLDKYYKALDGTIMAYHNQKMSEINKIIRELWRNTYRGNDIETIEIRSDEEEGSGAAKTRRSYRYRVVMVKGHHELDMRGRCSAGQKVLASLIIRLALAETFCLNCGVLALDEPTTNLDRENIESLAFALVEIIKNRQKQRNFQLLVITHDEDFVELLGRSDYVEEYFKVSKNEFGCSRLVKSNVQDLHSR